MSFSFLTFILKLKMHSQLKQSLFKGTDCLFYMYTQNLKYHVFCQNQYSNCAVIQMTPVAFARHFGHCPPAHLNINNNRWVIIEYFITPPTGHKSAVLLSKCILLPLIYIPACLTSYPLCHTINKRPPAYSPDTFNFV